MTPDHGGRLELKLTASTHDAADYAAYLETRTGSFQARARVDSRGGDKQVEFEPWSGGEGAPPEWLVADARAALKAALRTAETEGRWPRRIARWRPEPED